ncbi:MAG: 23S rRNA (adenine(2503)-C(2))-methyltransferase RlmN [Pelolinea sp.]|nr:23S rRNA (adenine(2503)-C(2))-methyltransferase RlmN [Pelolinea sp.]
MEHILDLGFDSLEKRVLSFDEPEYRAKQIWEGLYKHFYKDWHEFTNLPNSLITTLSDHFDILPIQLINEEITADGNTIKTLFQLNDGLYIESVHLVNRNRNTICISTQVGCPVGCLFCATGRMGFFRNLFPSEIIGQILFFSNRFKKLDQKIQNIVLMGMGEPFLNFDATLQAMILLNDPTGFDIGARRITISTIGIVEKIIEIADENRQFNLAISLHAPNDGIRQKLIPIAKKYPIKNILTAADYYILKTNRRITYEYVLIDKINSTTEHALEFANLIKHQNCHVNLIALNPNSHFDGDSPSFDSITKFSKILLNNGIPTTIRNSQGSNIKAGCGQLAGTQSS